MVRDALTMGPRQGEDQVTPHTRPPADDDGDHMLVRTVLCLEGSVEIELVCEPVFDYGRAPAEWALVERRPPHRRRERRGPDDPACNRHGARHRGRLGSGPGTPSSRASRLYCSLSWAEDLASPAEHRRGQRPARRDDPLLARLATERARIPDHRWREPIQRSALAIKGLTYMPTGATVAALTTSLPETPGGERNWDYRYTWMRDSTFTLQALHYLNLDWEADEFMQFVADLEANEDGALQIMYGIDGRRDLTESTRDDLSGYAGPARCGSATAPSTSARTTSSAPCSTRSCCTPGAAERLPRRLWPIVQSQAECATKVWKQPDQGIWEARGEPQHYVSSKLMCWVALDRASKLAGNPRRPRAGRRPGAAPPTRSRPTSSSTASRDGVLRQHYDTEALDASTLLAAIFGFLPGDDETLHKSVLAIADDLTEDGFVLRYRTGETDDGLSGKEGSFLICSFWLVSALAIVGEEQRARDLMEQLLRVASPLGLYAEEFDTSTGRHLGNFPQAFSHLALIEAAARIILAERLEELS